MKPGNEQSTEVTERVSNPFGGAVPAPIGASANALVQREVAEVQAAMVIAKRFPRDPVAAVDRIITACSRSGLAEQAMYQYARGGQNIDGPSIRLAEELARGWGNMLAGVTELSRGAGVSECLAYAWDLETNYRDEKRFQIRHWRDTRSGGHAIKEERDIYELIANNGARRKRACILAIIPGDVTDAAVKQCNATLKTKADVTPERIKAMVAAFGAFNVTAEMLEKRVQRRLDTITPALFVNLMKIHNSIRDGMSAAGDWFEATPSDPAAPPAGGTRSAQLADKLKPKAEPEAPAPEEPAAAAVPDLMQALKDSVASVEQPQPEIMEATLEPTVMTRDQAIAAINAAIGDSKKINDIARNTTKHMSAEDAKAVRVAAHKAQQGG